LGAIGAIAVAALVGGWAHRASHPKPVAATLAPAAVPEKPPVLSAAERVKRARSVAPQPVASATAKKDEKPKPGDELVVVPDPVKTTGKIIWTKELDGVTATLLDNGIIGYSRKLDPGEKPAPGPSSWPKQAAAAVDRLVAEAQEYAKANLVTMPRRDYDQMVAAEEDQRVFHEAEQEAAIEAQLDEEGVPKDQRRAVAEVEHEPKFE